MPIFAFLDRGHTRGQTLLAVAVTALLGCGAQFSGVLREDGEAGMSTWQVAGSPTDYLGTAVERSLVHVRLDCAGGNREHGSAFVVKRSGRRAFLVSAWQLFHPKAACQVERVVLQGAGIVPVDLDTRGADLDGLLGLRGRRESGLSLLSVAAEPSGPALPLGTSAPTRYTRAGLLTASYVAGAAGASPTPKATTGTLFPDESTPNGPLLIEGQADPWAIGGPVVLAATGQVVAVVSERPPANGQRYLAASILGLDAELREQAELDLRSVIAPYGLDRLPRTVVTRPEEAPANQALGRRSPPPFVLLFGGADVGKTALANKLAWDHVLSGQFPDGVVRVLVHERATDDLLGELHRAVLNRPPPQQLGDMVAALAGALRGRRILVVLDDLRWEGERLPSELLQALGDTAVLATSRRHYVDGRVQTVEVGSLSRDLARQMLRGGLNEGPLRILSEGDLDLIAERLGFNPLALGLAVEVLNRTEVAAEPFLEHLQAQRLRAIDEGEMSGPLAAVLEMTWEGLSPSERNVTMGMGLLAEAPVLPELLAAMLGESLATVDSALAHLATAGVVDSPAQGRGFSMHPLIHVWAHEKADGSWFRGWKRDRLVGWYLARAKDLPVGQWGPILAAHLQAAQEWAVRDGKVVQVYDLADAWHNRLRELGPWSLWDRMWRNAVESALRGEDLKTLMLALRQLAWTRELAGYGNNAEPLYRDSLQLARDLRDQRAIVEVLNQLGTRAGSSAAAIELLKESLTQAQILGDQRLVATTETLLAWAYEASGDYPSAEKGLTHSLDIYQQLGDNKATVGALRNLYALALQRKDFDGAKRWLERSIEACGAESECAVPSYIHLGRLADQRGDTAEGQRQYDRALSIVSKLPDTGYLAQVLDELAHREARKGDLAGAMRLWQKARDSAESAGDLRRKIDVAVDGADLAYRLRDYTTLEEQLQLALELAGRIGERRGHQIYVSRYDYLRWSRQSLADQLSRIQDARHQAQLAQADGTVARAELALARIWRMRRDVGHADAMLERSAAYYDRRRDAEGQALIAAERTAVAVTDGTLRPAKAVQAMSRALAGCEKAPEAARPGCLREVALDAQEVRLWVPALRGLERRLQLLRPKDDPVELANATEDLAELAMARGDRPLAQRRYQEALGLWQRVRADVAIARLLERLARLSWERSDWLGAQQWLGEATALLPTIPPRGEIAARIKLLQAQIALRNRQRQQARALASDAADLLGKLHSPEAATARSLLLTIDSSESPRKGR